MGLDERLFGGLHRWWTRRRRAADMARELAVEVHEPMLRRLVPLLAGLDLDLGFGDDRSVLGQRLALPRTLPFASSADDAWQALLWRVALQAAAHATGTAVAADRPPAAALREALPQLHQWLAAEWPGALDLAPAAARHCAALAKPSDAALLTAIGSLPLPPPPTPRGNIPQLVPREALPNGTERPKPQRNKRRAEVVQLPQHDDGGNPLAHVFEKVKTAEEHTGGHRTMDGSDELDSHLEALEELDLTQVVRTTEATASVFRADVELDSRCVDIVDQTPPADELVHYDEWDATKRCYLPSWCAVRPGESPSPPDPAAARSLGQALRARHGALLRTLQLEFARIAQGQALQRRQSLGAELDLDAIVDHHGTVVAARRGDGTSGEARLYLDRRPAPRDVAALVLLDRSLSSDSWVQGRRVLDVARDATYLLGEVMQNVQLPVALATFCSHSRHDCRFDVVKDFAEDWRRRRDHLYGVVPDGYTRIGPAIRHATRLLTRQPARRRLLLVVSDCKPVDYDHYEGRRGIGDVQQALREARAASLTTLALAIDGRAGAHLARMFGPHGFRIVPSVPTLATAMARLHERLLQ